MSSSTLGLIALLANILAWASYLPVSKSPRLRRTMWPVLAGITLTGALACVALWRARVELVPAPTTALSTILSCVLFALVYFLMLRVPRAHGRPEVGQRWPEIQLFNVDGAEVGVRTLVPRGPVLLVFYRGFW